MRQSLSFSALLDSTRIHFFPILGIDDFRNAGKEMNTTLKISYTSLKKIFFQCQGNKNSSPHVHSSAHRRLTDPELTSALREEVASEGDGRSPLNTCMHQG